MGKHAELAPKMVANAYLADAEDVKMAKAEFMKAFEKAEKGEIELPEAPKAVVYNAAPAFYNYAHAPYYAGYPYTYNTVAPYTTAYATAAYHPYTAANWAYPYYNYQGYFPQQFVAVKPAEAVEQME